MKIFNKQLIALAIVPLLLLQSGCTSTQESTILADLNEVVNLATAVLSVIQSFGGLTTPQEVADVQTAEQLAGQYSAVASQAITEFNSSDTWAVKVQKIDALLLAVTPIAPIETAKIKAAVALLTAAVQLLISQLQADSGTTVAPALSVKSLGTETAKVGGFFAGFLPGTLHHRLKVIQSHADANVALAGRLQAIAHSAAH